MATINQAFHHMDISRQLEESHADLITTRKRAEAELRRLTAIVEFSDDAIVSQTPEGLILSWNPGAERTFGYTVSEAIGQSVFMLVPPAGADEFRFILARISKGDRVQDLKTRQVRKDGAIIVVSLTLLPIKTNTGEVGGVWTIARDITAKDRLEDLLRLQGQVLANLAEGVALIRARDAVIVYATERFETMFGYDSGELMGKPVFILNAAGDHSPEETADLIIHSLKKHGVWRGEIQNVRKDGVVFWTYGNISTFEHPEHGTVWVNAQSDITERRQVEQALHESEERLKAVVQTAMDAIITSDVQGVIDSVNPAAELLFGYSATEMVGQNVKMLMPFSYPGERESCVAHRLQTGVKQIIGLGREVQARKKNGLTFPVDLAVSEFFDRGRRMFTGVIRDISARKQLEREVLEIATTEQRRIGQELHDSTGQELTALGLLAETLTETLASRSAAETPIAAKMVSGLKRTLAQVRAISRGLIPVEVDSQGLEAALADLAARTSELQGITCTFASKQPVQVEDNLTATHLFYIAQEAVTNALRHGRATHIAIDLEDDEHALTLRIQDNGIGFVEESVEGKGMGIKIMLYRAGLINARLTLGSEEPAGTMMTCTVTKGFPHDRTP